MSSYMVGDATINKIVSWLDNETCSDNEITYGGIARALSKAGHFVRTDDFEQNLAAAMFALNILAVEDRYGEGEAEKFRPLDYKFRRVLPPTVYQALKSINCWHYQCAEGKAIDDPLFKAFEKIIGLINAAIVRTLPQYENAQWD
jgi:hypothetical protein